jgi:hypothetical protein
MKIGLIDVDGHHFPNLALMRISAWHKSQGDEVEWWWSDFVHYDVVYMSKVFSGAFSKDVPEPMNADKVVKGGSGYAISLVDGREVYDKAKDPPLPPEIERMSPDYSIYPQFTFAISMTSRGCPRGCGFCHVGAKEGRASVRVGSVSDFWTGQERIEVLDPNITACPEKRELFRQYLETRAIINFNQGLDIRLLDDADIADMNQMRITRPHFAWDNPKEDLTARFANFASKFRRTTKIGRVYILTNYGSTMEENLFRVYTLRDLGFDPYITIYNKPSAPKEVVYLQQWCNNPQTFNKIRDFTDYVPNQKWKADLPAVHAKNDI